MGNMPTCQGSESIMVMVSIEARYHITCLITFLQIFIKAVKSPNPTFIDCERLSPEGLESELYELKSDDNCCMSQYVPFFSP
jgi:hypothetical protein